MKDKKTVQQEVRELVKNRISSEGVNNLTNILKEARTIYLKKMANLVKDPEQSWKPFKGALLEDIIYDSIDYLIRMYDLKLRIVKGSKLNSKKLESAELNRVRRNLLINYGEYGSFLPDIDLVIYDPSTYKVKAILSSKATLRERIAQTCYWKLKLEKNNMKDIKVFLITLDEDRDLIREKQGKGKALAAHDTDMVFVISDSEIPEDENIRNFQYLGIALI